MGKRRWIVILAVVAALTLLIAGTAYAAQGGNGAQARTGSTVTTCAGDCDQTQPQTQTQSQDGSCDGTCDGTGNATTEPAREQLRDGARQWRRRPGRQRRAGPDGEAR